MSFRTMTKPVRGNVEAYEFQKSRGHIRFHNRNQLIILSFLLRSIRFTLGWPNIDPSNADSERRDCYVEKRGENEKRIHWFFFSFSSRRPNNNRKRRKSGEKNVNSPYDLPFFQHLSLGNESFSLEKRFREVSRTGWWRRAKAVCVQWECSMSFSEKVPPRRICLQENLGFEEKGIGGRLGKLFIHSCSADETPTVKID